MTSGLKGLLIGQSPLEVTMETDRKCHQCCQGGLPDTKEVEEGGGHLREVLRDVEICC